MSLVKGVAPALKKLRLDNRLTLRELQALSGLPYSHLNNFELGKTTPSLESLTKVAKAYRLTLASLLLYIDLVAQYGPINILDLKKYYKKVEQTWTELKQT